MDAEYKRGLEEMADYVKRCSDRGLYAIGRVHHDVLPDFVVTNIPTDKAGPALAKYLAVFMNWDGQGDPITSDSE